MAGVRYDLLAVDQVKALQANLRTLPLTHADNMAFLEQLCGWFDFHEDVTDRVLIANGKRQVLATLKTLMDCTAEDVVRVVASGT